MQAPASVLTTLKAFIDAVQIESSTRIASCCSPTVSLDVRGLKIVGARDVAAFFTSHARVESASQPEVFAWGAEGLTLFDVEAVRRGSAGATLFACVFTLSEGRITAMTIGVRAR